MPIAFSSGMATASQLLADARLGLEPLELAFVAPERVVGAATAEERQQLALLRVLEPQRRAAVHRLSGERNREAAADLVPLVRAADLPVAGENHARGRDREQQREERLPLRRHQGKQERRRREAEQVDADGHAPGTGRAGVIGPAECEPRSREQAERRRPERVAREEGEDGGDELEREDESDQEHADVLLLRDRNPADREGREQQHPDAERVETERQAAADRP